MDSIGNSLRNERQRRGLRLDQISEWTKIGTLHLQAMEADRFDRLPGGLFTRSFLRQYAHLLDLDEEQLMAAYRERYEAPIEPLPEPPPKCTPLRLPLAHPFGWLVLAVVLCGAVYSIWQNGRQNVADSQSPRVSPTVAPAITPPLASASVRSSQNVASSAQAGVHILFSATEPVWLSIQSDGKHAYSGTLEALERKEMAASSKMSVLVGNAGGLDVSVNGKSIGPLGGHGQVRLLELTPGGTHIFHRPTASETGGSLP